MTSYPAFIPRAGSHQRQWCGRTGLELSRCRYPRDGKRLAGRRRSGPRPLEAAQKRTQLGRDILELLNRVGVEQLPHDSRLVSKLLRFYADCWVEDAERYWLAIDLADAFFWPVCRTASTTGGFVFSECWSGFHGLRSSRRTGDGETLSGGPRWIRRTVPARGPCATAGQELSAASQS